MEYEGQLTGYTGGDGEHQRKTTNHPNIPSVHFFKLWRIQVNLYSLCGKLKLLLKCCSNVAYCFTIDDWCIYLPFNNIGILRLTIIMSGSLPVMYKCYVRKLYEGTLN